MRAAIPPCPPAAIACGGKNHGAGEAAAIDNTRELFEGWVERYAQTMGLTDYRAELASEVAQLRMF